MRTDAGPFPFVQVEGPGVYEIPVGPVHAGLIEPGHFRFSVVGETILKMKARLWFTHRGIEKLFEGRDIEDGVALAERISGDSAIGHNLAYCLAVEEACGIDVPEEAAALRALLLELERVYNHVADIGALCNDVGFGLAQARALTLREQLLRLNAEVTGHRLLRERDPARRRLAAASPDLARARRDRRALRGAGRPRDLEHRRDGPLPRDCRALLRRRRRHRARLGVVARASGHRTRCSCRASLRRTRRAVPPRVRTAGDVMLALPSESAEVRVSLALIDDTRRAGLGAQCRGAAGRRAAAARGSASSKVGVGASSNASRSTASARSRVCKIVDPSFLNWPALSVALADTIVPDFPLANKSFNLSYAGNDL